MTLRTVPGAANATSTRVQRAGPELPGLSALSRAEQVDVVRAAIHEGGANDHHLHNVVSLALEAQGVKVLTREGADEAAVVARVRELFDAVGFQGQITAKDVVQAYADNDPALPAEWASSRLTAGQSMLVLGGVPHGLPVPRPTVGPEAQERGRQLLGLLGRPVAVKAFLDEVRQAQSRGRGETPEHAIVDVQLKGAHVEVSLLRGELALSAKEFATTSLARHGVHLPVKFKFAPTPPLSSELVQLFASVDSTLRSNDHYQAGVIASQAAGLLLGPHGKQGESILQKVVEHFVDDVVAGLRSKIDELQPKSAHQLYTYWSPRGAALFEGGKSEYDALAAAFRKLATRDSSAGEKGRAARDRLQATVEEARAAALKAANVEPRQKAKEIEAALLVAMLPERADFVATQLGSLTRSIDRDLEISRESKAKIGGFYTRALDQLADSMTSATKEMESKGFLALDMYFIEDMANMSNTLNTEADKLSNPSMKKPSEGFFATVKAQLPAAQAQWSRALDATRGKGLAEGLQALDQLEELTPRIARAVSVTGGDVAGVQRELALKVLTRRVELFEAGKPTAEQIDKLSSDLQFRAPPEAEAALVARLKALPRP